MFALGKPSWRTSRYARPARDAVACRKPQRGTQTATRPHSGNPTLHRGRFVLLHRKYRCVTFRPVGWNATRARKMYAKIVHRIWLRRRQERVYAFDKRDVPSIFFPRQVSQEARSRYASSVTERLISSSAMLERYLSGLPEKCLRSAYLSHSAASALIGSVAIMPSGVTRKTE